MTMDHNVTKSVAPEYRIRNNIKYLLFHLKTAEELLYLPQYPYVSGYVSAPGARHHIHYALSNLEQIEMAREEIIAKARAQLLTSEETLKNLSIVLMEVLHDRN